MAAGRREERTMLAKATVGALFLLLVWGNLVAGLKAGLACPDWPLCHGKVLPPLRWDICMEFLHRVLGAAAGGLFLALSWRRFRAYRGAARAVPAAAAALFGAEAVLGGMVVLLGLPARLATVHFAAGVAVFLAACYMAAVDGTARKPSWPAGARGWLFLAMTGVLYAVAVLGAWVRHAGAGAALAGWPLSDGGLLPETLRGGALLHFSHRAAAAFAFLTTAALYAAASCDERLGSHREAARRLFLLCLGQVVAGGIVVLSGLSFAAAGLHLVLTLAMLATAAGMWLRETGAGGGARWSGAS